MESCWVCGEVHEEIELQPSPSGSGKMVCPQCAEDIRRDLEGFNEEG